MPTDCRPNRAPLPSDWRERLIPFQNDNTRGVTALCLHPLDLASSKLVAGREKDVDFVAAMLTHGLIEPRALENQIGLLPAADQRERAGQILTVVRSKVTRDRD